jgi:hypothetical protein
MFSAWSSSTPSLASRRAWSSGMARKAISRNTNHAGVAGVAAALLEPDDGYLLGSLAIAGPDHRLPDEALEQPAGPLTAAAGELAPQLAAVLFPTHRYARTPWTSSSRIFSARDRRGRPAAQHARFPPPGKKAHRRP